MLSLVFVDVMFDNSARLLVADWLWATLTYSWRVKGLDRGGAGHNETGRQSRVYPGQNRSVRIKTPRSGAPSLPKLAFRRH